ncbi:hypothetical protein Trydic_g23058, partial [Trypoxylus dichotomus]
EGPVDTSNSQPHFGEFTVLGQRRSEISSPASSGSILNGGIVGPTFTASNTIQNARHGQSSYDCDGGACGIDSTHLSNDGAQYNRIIEEEATNTSNPNHSDQATIYGQAHGRSISSEGVVGPGFGTSTSVESTLAGGENTTGQSPRNCGGSCGSDNAHVSKEGTAYNTTGTNSHPYHEQSIIHGQAESKI